MIPQNSPLHGHYIANNFLEFLAMVITIQLVLLECEETGRTQECILGLGDNTSAIGWLYKTKGVKPDSVNYEAVTQCCIRQRLKHSSLTLSWNRKGVDIPQPLFHDGRL